MGGWGGGGGNGVGMAGMGWEGDGGGDVGRLDPGRCEQLERGGGEGEEQQKEEQEEEKSDVWRSGFGSIRQSSDRIRTIRRQLWVLGVARVPLTEGKAAAVSI